MLTIFVVLSKEINGGTRHAVKRVLFQALGRIFCPLDEDDIPERQEPVSVEKLKK